MVHESTLLLVLDLTGTFVFALNGALTAIEAARVDLVGVITLGVITAIGGGTIRDVLVRRIPSVLHSEGTLYAIPALVAAGIAVAADCAHVYGVPAALGAVTACFGIRMPSRCGGYGRSSLKAPSQVRTARLVTGSGSRRGNGGRRRLHG
jgi:uncharacterized membrane protein YeiH